MGGFSFYRYKVTAAAAADFDSVVFIPTAWAANEVSASASEASRNLYKVSMNCCYILTRLWK